MQDMKHLSQMTLQEVSLQLKVQELVLLNFVLYQRLPVSQVLVVVTQSFLRNLKEMARTFTSYGTEEKLLSLMVFTALQCAAAAVLSEEGQKEFRENISYYQENAKIIASAMDEEAFTTQVVILTLHLAKMP